MILLEPQNRIIEDALTARIKGEPAACDISLADFDGIQYHVLCQGETKNKITVSMAIKHFAELSKNGADKCLKDDYKDLLSSSTESGYDVTLELDLNNLPGDKDAVIKKVAQLKRNVMGAPLKRILEDVNAGKAGNLTELHYRPDESIFIQPQKDQVTVIFIIRFTDPDDIIIAKVFLQEFADARRHVTNAPSVAYHKDPPGELKGVRVPEGDDIGYVSFVLFKRQCEPSQHENTITNIQFFRDYLHYHIKCSKAYLHSRMRTRVQDWMKVINRARQETEFDKKEKKLATTGRTFVRK